MTAPGGRERATTTAPGGRERATTAPGGREGATVTAPGGRDGSRLSSVQNAARLLKEFGSGERELGVSELSRRLGLGKSTVHRLLATLTDERILEHDPARGTYRLGLVIYELGARVSVHRVLHDAATPILEALRNATKETVQIAVLDSREVVYVERLESPHTLRLFGRIGHRNSAHCTSNGKVLLAYLPEDRREALLKGWRPERRTAYTIWQCPKLREELERVRARGWATNISESEVGVASVAAPIRNARGEVIASVSVAGPVLRLDGESLRRFFCSSVVQAADAISARLGYRPGAVAGGAP